MLNTQKPKKKRKPLKSKMARNMKMVITLSDRLKQAGIKECEPSHEITTQNLSKISKTRKNHNKKSYLDKHAKAGFKRTSKPTKRLRDLPKDFILPYLKDSYQNEILREDVEVKNPEGLSKDLSKNIEGSAKETIFVSLDFIKDCQKYKSKFRNPRGDAEFKYHPKNVKFFTTSNKQCVYAKEESQKLLGVSQVPSCGKTEIKENLITNVSKAKKTEILSERDDFLCSGKNCAEKVSVEDEQKNQPEIKVAKFSLIQSSHDPPAPEVATIDKKYLESILSITNNTETDDKTHVALDESNESEETVIENRGYKKKKKITGKAYFESKRKNKEREKKILEDKIELRGSALENKKDLTTLSGASYNDRISIRIVRDSTKSEVQIKLKKDDSHKQRGSEMKSEKNVAHSKSRVNDVHRKRKTRNIILRNRNEKFFETPFSGEVSKVADIKELWRRETSEKSENSLSSQSSSTVPETDESPEWKSLGLESYKILEKLVEEEVNKITKKSENRNNMGDINNKRDFKTGSTKESEKPKNDCHKLQALKSNLTELFGMNKTKDNILKRRLQEAERPQYYSTYEGEKPKSQLLNLFAQDKLEDSKSKLKLLEKKENKGSKIPSQIIQNWSILNRLEQAFLALGTPNFPNKGINNPSPLKNKHLSGSEKNTADSEMLQKKRVDKKFRKIKKSKETLCKTDNKDSVSILRSSPDTSAKITIQTFQSKNDKSTYSRNFLKEKQQGIFSGKESKFKTIRNNTISLKISEDENHLNHKKKELHKQTTLTVLGKSKLCDSKSRYLKKKTQDIKFSSDSPFLKHTKAIQVRKKKSSRQLVHSTTSEEPLERKNTFDIITVKNPGKVQPRKSKSCTKIDESPEQENVKKRFLPITNQDSKSLCCFEDTMKEKSKSRSRSIDSDTEMKTNLKTMKNLRKPVIKEKTSTHSEKLRSASEKEKKTRESVVKTPKGKILENKCEKTEPSEELPEQCLLKKNLNQIHLNERAVKERSILSIRGNQVNTQAPTKTLEHIQETPAPDISLELESKAQDLQVKATSENELLQKTKPKTKYEYSSVSCTSTETYDLLDSNPHVDNTEKHNEFDVNRCQKQLSDISEILSSLSSLSISVYSDLQNDELNKNGCETLWEQDIHYYHTVVKEIMSHYKRLGGFLKQSEPSEDCSGSNSIKLMLTKDETQNNLDDSMKIDIQEYRKKIMLEYETLPFFEYNTTKLQQKKEQPISEETKKRNLSVVKDLKTGMDLDVKDYQPKIQNVLGSQLYVDLENLAKRNCPNVKCTKIKSSLQEIVLSKSEKTVPEEECPRTNSSPKAFLQLDSSSSQKIKIPESSQGDFSSVYTSGTYLEETESET